MKKLRMILFTILLLIIGGYANAQASGMPSFAASVSMSSAFLSNNQHEQSSLDNSSDVIDIDQLLESQAKKFQAGQQVTVLLPDGTYSGKSKTVNITVKGKKMADMKLSDGSEYAEVTFLAQMTGGDVVQFIANFECDDFLFLPSCNCNDGNSSISSSILPQSSSTCVSKSLGRSSSRISIRVSSSSHEGVKKQPLYFNSQRSFKPPLNSSSKSVIYVKSSKEISGGVHSAQKLRSSSHYGFYSRHMRSLPFNSSSNVSSYHFRNQGMTSASSSRCMLHSKSVYKDDNCVAHTVSLISGQDSQIIALTGSEMFSRSRWNAIDSTFPLDRLPLSDVHSNHIKSKPVIVHHRHKHTYTHRLAIRGRLPETRMDPYTGLYSLIGLIIVIISGRALLSKKDKGDQAD